MPAFCNIKRQRAWYIACSNLHGTVTIWVCVNAQLYQGMEHKLPSLQRKLFTWHHIKTTTRHDRWLYRHATQKCRSLCTRTRRGLNRWYQRCGIIYSCWKPVYLFDYVLFDFLEYIQINMPLCVPHVPEQRQCTSAASKKCSQYKNSKWLSTSQPVCVLGKL